jgi:hypothetical protein
MASTINSSTSNGIVITPDTSGEIELQANGVTQAKVTANGLQDANGNSITGGMYRNLIINGDMNIAQRGTSASGVTGAGYHTVDRMFQNMSSAGTWTISQDTDVPTGQGFATSLKFDCTTANASLSAGSFFLSTQYIEGQNVQQLKKGTANAESTTLSFWVKSNKTGTYIAYLYDNDNGRSISKSYTIDTADTWEKKTLTYVGDTTGTLDNDNARSLDVTFLFVAGTDWSGGTLNTSWNSLTLANTGVGQVNLADSTSNYINITGLQFEVGSGASDFEFLPYDVQLARCQRYCQVYSDALNGNAQLALGYTYNATLGLALYQNFKAQMRALPSLTASGSFIFNEQKSTGYNGISASGVAINQASNENCHLQCTISGGTSGTPATLAFSSSTSGKLIFSAEL